MAFGAVFLIPGLVIFGWGVWNSYQIWQAQSWAWVPAQVLEVEQIKRRTEDGDYVYSVRGLFQYYVKGQRHFSRQLSFYPKGDNVGQFQQQLYFQLDYDRRKKRTIRAYVNPDNYSEAVIDRTMRWEMLGFKFAFFMAFGGVGLGIIVVAWVGNRKLQKEDLLREQNSGEPWRWKPDWESRRAGGGSKVQMWVTIFGAIVWNAMSIPAGIGVTLEADFTKEPIKLLAYIMPLIGVWLIILSVIYARRYLKFGKSEVYMQEWPLAIGSLNKGHILISSKMEHGAEVMITLVCHNRYKSRFANETRTSTNIIWESSFRSHIKINDGDAYSIVPFKFDIPPNLPSANDSDPSDIIEWILRVERKQPGLDLSLRFIVPAFKIPGRVVKEPEEDSLFIANDKNGGRNFVSGGDWTYLDIKESIGNNGKSYYFPPFRHKFISLMLILLGITFLGVGVGVNITGNPPIFVSIMAAFFGGVGLYFGSAMLLYKSKITLNSSKLIVQSGKLSLGNTREIMKRDIVDIYSQSTMSSSSKKYYDIMLDTKRGESIVLAKYFLNPGDIEEFVRRLKKEVENNRS